MELYPDSLNRKMLRDSLLKNREIICSQWQSLKFLSKDVKQTFLTIPFVNFQDKFIPSRLEIDYANHGHEESRREQSQASWRVGATRQGTSRNSH